MSTTMNRQVLLVNRPTGEPTEGDFKLTEAPVPEPGAGQFLGRTVYLSLDPYMRGRMSARASYTKPAELGQVMVGGTVSQVVGSNHSGCRHRDLNSRLADVGPAASELGRLLGAQEEDARAAGQQLLRIGLTVKMLQGLIADYEPRLTAVRQRTEQLKSRTLPWITPAVILISVVCLWVALSQLSLMAHTWSWWTRAGHSG
jgi:hypothetical protein